MERGPSSISEQHYLSLVHNALSVAQQEDGYFQAYRFCDPEAKRFSSHALYRAMAKTSAGTCLRFRTDEQTTLTIKRYAQSLLPQKGDSRYDFAAAYGRPIDLSETLDLVYDGQAPIHFPLREGSLKLQKGRDVQFFLPLHHQVGFLLDRPVQPVEKRKKTLLCMGDSIVQGVGIHHPSESLCAQLSSLLDSEIINQGLIGAITDPQLAQNVVTPVPISMILISFGTNDWSMRESLSDLRGDMFALLGRIRKFHPDVPVLLLTPLWRSDIQEQKKMGTFQQLQQALVQAAKWFPHVQVIDGLTLSLRNAYDDAFIHPNYQGVSFLAKQLAPYLR